MCKGLFKVKSERKIKGVDVISYLKKQSVLAKGIAVCFAIFILASCGKIRMTVCFRQVKVLSMLTEPICPICVVWKPFRPNI